MIVTIEDLRTAARRRLPRALFDYIDGGAEDEVTLRDNQADFQRYRFRPRALVDVSRRDQSTTVLGVPVASPLILAPTGFTGMFWPRGEAVAARAAGRKGVIYTASTMSICSMEEIAEAATGAIFWLCVWRDRGIVRMLMSGRRRPATAPRGYGPHRSWATGATVRSGRPPPAAPRWRSTPARLVAPRLPASPADRLRGDLGGARRLRCDLHHPTVQRVIGWDTSVPPGRGRSRSRDLSPEEGRAAGAASRRSSCRPLAGSWTSPRQWGAGESSCGRRAAEVIWTQLGVVKRTRRACMIGKAFNYIGGSAGAV
jgi:hypothetical protein